MESVRVFSVREFAQLVEARTAWLMYQNVRTHVLDFSQDVPHHAVALAMSTPRRRGPRPSLKVLRNVVAYSHQHFTQALYKNAWDTRLKEVNDNRINQSHRTQKGFMGPRVYGRPSRGL